MNCDENIVTPTNNTPVPCDGIFKNTECILTEVVLPYLEISVGDSQTEINQQIATTLQYLQTQITALTARVVALENP